MVETIFPTSEVPVNLSRRQFLAASASSATAATLVLGFGLPVGPARAQPSGQKFAPGTRVQAFLEIRPDNTVRFQCPFIEGGQGIFTGMAQIVGEELDVDPSMFIVENAPAGTDFKVMKSGIRITGGSQSVRTSYPTMRRLGAIARRMILQAGAKTFGVPLVELTTEPGQVIHAASGRSMSYGQLAPAAIDEIVPDPASVPLKDPKDFRWIGKPLSRLDVHAKATGKAIYAIDIKVDGMLHAAVQHAPRLGMTVGAIINEDQIKAVKGVHSIHVLDGAVGVVAERWWTAKRAAEGLQIRWEEPSAGSTVRYMPADFSTETYRDMLSKMPGDGEEAEVEGNLKQAMANAQTIVAATYTSQYVKHAQLEPPSALARFNADGSLELWIPNQAPEFFQADAAKRTGVDPGKIQIHSPLLGGFFGRHFVYNTAMAYPQAIQMAKATGRPIKLIWSREEEFLRDTARPMAVVRFRAGLDSDGMPVALEAVSVTEGPTEGINNKRGEKLDGGALEGLAGKSYTIANRRIAQLYHKGPMMLGYWRSVGASMNDFFYESFLDELADKAGKDPFELRMSLLEGNVRLRTLLDAAAELSGGWKRGPYTAEDGTRRARGVAMAAAFGTETAAIAEVSFQDGNVKVHHVWEAIDPGMIINPALVNAQVSGAVALGLSQVLVEEAIYESGMPVARNYDLYPILPPDRMAQVHVKIIESGAPIGGIGEPPLPAVPPAVANAVSILTGKRVRSMPISKLNLKS